MDTQKKTIAKQIKSEGEMSTETLRLFTDGLRCSKCGRVILDVSVYVCGNILKNPLCVECDDARINVQKEFADLKSITVRCMFLALKFGKFGYAAKFFGILIAGWWHILKAKVRKLINFTKGYIMKKRTKYWCGFIGGLIALIAGHIIYSKSEDGLYFLVLGGVFFGFYGSELWKSRKG